MAGAFRMAYLNYIFTSGGSLSASSFVLTLPPSFLLDQLRSKVWRSEGPYVVVEGANDTIDFDEGGADLEATLTPGVYASATLYLDEVETQLNAAGALTYTVSYATNDVTIAASGNFTLQWSTGTNDFKTAGIDMGFDVTADDTGTNSYTGDFNSLQGQHFVQLDLPEALVPGLVVCGDHNVPEESAFNRNEIWIQGSISGSWASGPSYSQELVGDAGFRLLEPSDAGSPWNAVRSLRLIFRDISGADGFSECGLWYVGTITPTTIRPSVNYTRNRQELSQITQAIDGAHHADIRPEQDIHGLEWLDLTESNRDEIIAVAAAMPPGQNFFLNFDEEDLPDTVYGCWASGLSVGLAANPIYWNVSGSFMEALG